MPKGIKSSPEFRAQACRQVTEFSRPVREVAQTWAGLAPRDFDAVDDLVATFIEDPTERAWRHVDVVGRVETGGYDVAIVRSRSVLAMIEVGQLTLFSIGVPADGD
jgi:hypothetical protein